MTASQSQESMFSLSDKVRSLQEVVRVLVDRWRNPLQKPVILWL